MKGIEKLQKKLDEIGKIGKSNKFLKKVGIRLEQNIRNRTRDGFGNDQAGKQPRPLRPLKSETIRRRRKKRLHPRTTASKSNLTESGQMLDSMQNRVSGGKVEISFKNIKRIDGDISNGALANLHEQGTRKLPKRSFINPTRQEVDAIIDQLISEVVKKFKE